MIFFYAQKRVKIRKWNTKKNQKYMNIILLTYFSFGVWAPSDIYSSASSALKTKQHWSAAEELLTNWSPAEITSLFLDVV